MTSWEYKIIQYAFNNKGMYEMKVQGQVLEGPMVLEYLNSLGKEGWELVAAIPEIGHYVPPKDRTSHMLNTLFAMESPASHTHKTTTVGHTLWFKRPLNGN